MLQEELRSRLCDIRNSGDNNKCADCGSPSPEWISISLKVFLCLKCCGVHRQMGTSISRVRSIRLDEWTDETIRSLEDLTTAGNKVSKEHYEHQLPLYYRCIKGEYDSAFIREEFILAKYSRKEFVHDLTSAKNVPVKGGFLHKQAKYDQSKWKQRFFHLSGKVLRYFKSPDSIENPLGELQIDRFSRVFVVPGGDKFCLQIMAKPCGSPDESERCIYVKADSGRECFEWLNKIRLAKSLCVSIESSEPLQNCDYDRLLACEPLETADVYAYWTFPKKNILTSLFDSKKQVDVMVKHWKKFKIFVFRDAIYLFDPVSYAYPFIKIALVNYYTDSESNRKKCLIVNRAFVEHLEDAQCSRAVSELPVPVNTRSSDKKQSFFALFYKISKGSVITTRRENGGNVLEETMEISKDNQFTLMLAAESDETRRVLFDACDKMFIKLILAVLIVCFSIVATSPVLEKRQENNGCPDFKSCNNDLKNAGDLVQSFGQPVSGLICVYSNAASCNIQAGVTSFCAKDGVVYFGYASASGQMSFNGCP